MDIQAYIASGILEAYALDELPADERKQVEVMFTQHPELLDELNIIEEGLETLAMETAMTPPSSLKENIMDSLDAELTADDRTSPEQEARVVPLKSKQSGIWKYLVAASVSIALVSSFMAYDFYSRWQQSKLAYADIANSNELLAEQNQKVNGQLDQIEEDYKILVNPDFGKIEMGSVIAGKTFSASVFWNQKTQEAYLNIQELPELSAEQEYQLWAIVDGKPVDMGLFSGTEASLTKMKSVTGAATFAVTIEPKGGSINPTLDQMQVAGNVG